MNMRWNVPGTLTPRTHKTGYNFAPVNAGTNPVTKISPKKCAGIIIPEQKQVWAQGAISPLYWGEEQTVQFQEGLLCNNIYGSTIEGVYNPYSKGGQDYNYVKNNTTLWPEYHVKKTPQKPITPLQPSLPPYHPSNPFPPPYTPPDSGEHWYDFSWYYWVIIFGAIGLVYYNNIL